MPPSPSTQNLTIVLLCSGNGSDDSSYRPSRDDVRYRHRHDALVRCVASSLYGPAGSDDGCELILLYDGDLSCMRMKLELGSSNGTIPPPLEREVVRAWKEAAKAAVRRRENRHSKKRKMGNVGTLSTNHQADHHLASDRMAPRLKTVCELDLWKKVEPLDSSDETKSGPNGAPLPKAAPTTTEKLPSRMPSSKRDALAILQSTCPVEYLRRHRLNVPADAALRRASRADLRSAWDGYDEARREGGSSASDPERKRSDGGAAEKGGGDEGRSRMERAFRSLLSEAGAAARSSDGAGPGATVTAARLHESCDAELPCWGWDDSPRAAEEARHVFLFLGAVRDMTASENEALSAACSASDVPLVPCRLGPVPEFTSKIVSVAAFHRSRGVLGAGLVRLWKRARKEKGLELPSERNKIGREASGINSNVSRTIHNIAIVPMNSTALSSDPGKRDRVHWCLVRMCVCSLWRSKLASASDSNADGARLDNVLTFIFLDGICVTLEQKDFTTSMAENHKAAPSELQILEELCRRRDVVSSNKSFPLDPERKSEVKRALRNLVSTYLSSNHGDKQFALNILSHKQSVSNGMNSLYDIAYSDDLRQNNTDGYTLFTIQEVGIGRSDLSADETGCEHTTKKVRKIRKRLLQAFDTAGIAAMDSTLMGTQSREVQEEESCTIILLQHLEYQSRLLPILEMTETKAKQET